LRYSPALVLFAIVIADARQHSDPDLWGHVLFGRQLLAHGSLPRDNYSHGAVSVVASRMVERSPDGRAFESS
jgi:hypothetical protein